MSASRWGVLDELLCLAREGRFVVGWYQLHEIVAETERSLRHRLKRPLKVSQTALSARLRDLRRQGIIVDVKCERVGDGAGQHRYLYRIYSPAGQS